MNARERVENRKFIATNIVSQIRRKRIITGIRYSAVHYENERRKTGNGIIASLK